MRARSSARASLVACLCLALAPQPSLQAAPPGNTILSRPDADQIPAELLRPAIDQAVANGIGTLLARLYADGNDTGLVFPPYRGRKVVGVKKVPARRVEYEENIYEDEFAEVDQLVPEVSAGVPTGGFVRGKARVLVKRTKVGTRKLERLIPDPDGKEEMDIAEYGPGGPDLYQLNSLGFNGMALYLFVKAGLVENLATEKLASALAQRLTEYGLPDHTFDVAWLAAGFAALGPKSHHADVAADLVSKLIDGQIRERGEPRGLWGPVCINYGYFARLFETGMQVRQQLEVELPKMLDAASPQQQDALLKTDKDLRRLRSECQRAQVKASSQGTRMMEITTPFAVMPTVVLPGLPLYIYTRVVADVESTAAAAFAMAVAKDSGMLPKDTARVAIRGKKLHAAEKTETAVTLALERLAAAVRDDGGCAALTFSAVNTAFDKSRLPIPGVPYKGEFTPLFNLETATTCAHGMAALEHLTTLAPKPPAGSADKRKAARGRAIEIADRWYQQAAKGTLSFRPSTFESLKVPLADLKKSATLEFPPSVSSAVDSLPWGGLDAPYELLLGLAGLFHGQRGPSLLDDDLYRRLAYRVIGLQDANGQWQGFSIDSLSSGSRGLWLNRSAEGYHDLLNRDTPAKLADPMPYHNLAFANIHHGQHVWGGWHYWVTHRLDGGVYPTLASLLFLLDATEGPVNLAGVARVPDAKPATEGGDAVPPSPVEAVTKVERPNPARSKLYEAMLATVEVKPAAIPAAQPAQAPAATSPTVAAEAAARAGAAKAAGKEKDEDGNDLGSVDDLLKPAK